MQTIANEKLASFDPTADEHRDVVVVGSGPAGFTAALYAARADLDVLVLRGAEPGGQLTTTPEVENYPGFPDGVSGPELMTLLESQAVRFGAETRYGHVTALETAARPFRLLVDDDKVVSADAVILSTGASARYLGLDNEKRLLGRGVSACATCDGAFFRDQEVAVVGGGDSALEEALFLTRFATKVTVIHRRDTLRASKILQQRAFANDKITFLWNRAVQDVLGEERVEGVALVDTETGDTETLPVTGLFVAIGHRPNTDLVRDVVPLDDHGYIRTLPDTAQTGVPGLFACGDVQDPVYRQAITAAGSGCQAALDAERYLAEAEVASNDDDSTASLALAS